MGRLLGLLVSASANIAVAAIAVAGLAAITSAPSAWAAEQPEEAAPPADKGNPLDPAPRSNTVEEVIVTARMIEESAQDVPVAITALSTELKSPTVRDLTDLNGYSPNVTIGSDGSRGGRGAVIGIRGISPTRTDDNSFDVPVGVMIDDIYLGTIAGQVIENFDLERIEVLRGPQGTLFGKNTVGGVLRVFRSRPTGEWGARVKATLGDNNQQELRFVGNAPIIEDKLAVKVFGTTQQADGPMDNVTIGGQSADVDYKNYGATFLFTPNDAFEALFTIEKFDDQSDLQAFQTNGNYAPPSPNATLSCILYGETIPSACRTSTKTPSVSENDTRNESKLSTDAYTLNMSFDLNDHMQLVSITGYRDQSEYRIYDFDGSAAPFITIERWNDYHQTTQEFRIDSQWDDLKMTTGVYYFNNKFTQDWVTGGQFWGWISSGFLPTGIPPISTDQDTWSTCQTGAFAPLFCDTGLPLTPGFGMTQVLYETQDTTSIAAYSQVDWTFANDWTLTAGLRYTQETKDFTAGQSYLSNVARERLRNFPDYANLDNTWNELSPRIGVTYQLNDTSLVYATFNRGFHSGGFFGVNQNKRDFERDQYQPEYANAYEIGYKSTHFDDRLLLNVTLFRNDFEDKQESTIAQDPDTGTVATVFSNVADARYQGVELETQYVFSSYFRAFLNYGYLDSEYSKFLVDLDNPPDGILDDASNLTPRNAPENTVGAGGTFSWPIGPGSLEVYGKYAWIDKVETDLFNSPLGKLDSRKDVTASIGYVANQWAVTAFGKNLTDEEYEGIANIGGLFAVGSTNNPRTYGVEVEYNFQK